MEEETRQIVIAPRLDAAVPDAWQQQVADTPGITVMGSTAGRMQVRATAKGLDAAVRELGDVLHFEEVARREFPE